MKTILDGAGTVASLVNHYRLDDDIIHAWLDQLAHANNLNVTNFASYDALLAHIQNMGHIVNP